MEMSGALWPGNFTPEERTPMDIGQKTRRAPELVEFTMDNDKSYKYQTLSTYQ